MKKINDISYEQWGVYVSDDHYGKNRRAVKLAKSRRAALIFYNKLVKKNKYELVEMDVIKENK